MHRANKRKPPHKDPKPGRILELLVASIQSAIHGVDAHVESPGHLVDPTLPKGQDICEFDVVVRFHRGDAAYIVGIEVKDWHQPVPAGVVREFDDKASACGVHRKVIVSRSSFTAGAKSLAANRNIDLRRIKNPTKVEAEDLLTGVVFSYQEAWIFPRLSALTSPARAVGDYEFNDPEAGYIPVGRVIGEMQRLHKNVYFQRFASGEIEAVNASDVIEPIETTLTHPVDVRFKRSNLSYSVEGILAIFRFNVHVKPFSIRCLSYTDARTDQEFAKIQTATANDCLDLNLPFVSVAPAGATEQNLQRSRPDMQHLTTNSGPSVLFHIPMLGKPATTSERLIQSLGVDASFGLHVSIQTTVK